MARRTDGLKHVDRLEGPAEQKLRLRIVLEVLSGERTVEEACATLGIKPARLHELRSLALRGALAGIAPSKAGRPKRPAEPGGVRRLREENEELKEQLRVAELREELAMILPHVLTRRQGGKKRKGRKQ